MHVVGVERLERRREHDTTEVEDDCSEGRSAHGIDQHARVEDAGGIDRALRRLQRDRERLGALPVVSAPVIAPDRVVVGDRPARIDERVGRGGFDRLPLRELLAVLARARAQ